MTDDPHAALKMKVLVIDDEPLNIALLEDMLADAGYSRLRAYTDPRQALAAFADFQPDIVLLDLMMPHVDGFAVLEALRPARAETFLPVIVLTADVSDESKRRALTAGATDFLLKPFDQTEVLLRIRNQLQLRRLQLQLENQRAAFEDAVRMRSEQLRELRAQLA